MKYIFVVGGVVSSLGKGVLAASLGALLKDNGYKVRIKKMDPYLNVDPGTMNPTQHGEVFVTSDGVETDLDLGHYERFTGTLCNCYDSVSSGRIYLEILNKERRGDYLGSTIQVIPHVTNAIKDFIKLDTSDEDFLICEIGGTIGDIEATPFLESIRQFTNDVGKQNVMIVQLTYLPYLSTSEELKTKPTQHAVKELQSMGISPDILICRSSYPISDEDKRKLSLFCNVKYENVIPAYDLDSIYKVPSEYHKEQFEKRVLEFFGMNIKNVNKAAEKWNDIVKKIDSRKDLVNIAIVGKYVSLKDSYKSIIEALEHSSIQKNLKVKLRWISSENLENNGVNIEEIFKDIDGIMVAPGFGSRGVEGKIRAITYLRERNIPFFGICFGMQMAVIEYARSILGIKNATSSEIDKTGTYLISLASEWLKDGVLEKRNDCENKGATMRLGSYPCYLKEGSLAKNLYNCDLVHERHRHRYEVNPNYIDQLSEKGLVFSGMSQDGQLTEIVEIPSHRWFIAVQFHPELQSQLFKTHPLFDGFIDACYEYSKVKNKL